MKDPRGGYMKYPQKRINEIYPTEDKWNIPCQQSLAMTTFMIFSTNISAVGAAAEQHNNKYLIFNFFFIFQKSRIKPINWDFRFDTIIILKICCFHFSNHVSVAVVTSETSISDINKSFRKYSFQIQISFGIGFRVLEL